MSEKDIEYIRVAAYYIWENQGRPVGRDAEIWALAEKSFKKPAAKKNVAKSTAKKEPAKKVCLAMKKTATKKTATKSKINPVPVKSTATKIITPLYGSVKK